MKIVTNKYPIIKIKNLGPTPEVTKKHIEIEFPEGKVFKVLGLTYGAFYLECEGKLVEMGCDAFRVAFDETEIDL